MRIVRIASLVILLAAIVPLQAADPTTPIYWSAEKTRELFKEAAAKADFIIVNDGAGTIEVGGTIVNGKLDRPGEIRGDSIEGGTPCAVRAGDTLYVPKMTPAE